MYVCIYIYIYTYIYLFATTPRRVPSGCAQPVRYATVGDHAMGVIM